MKLATLLVASLLALLRGTAVAFLEENYDDCVCSTVSTQCYDLGGQGECCPGYACQSLDTDALSCQVDPDLDTSKCELAFQGSCKKDKDCCIGTNCNGALGQCTPNDANTGCTSSSPSPSEDGKACADIVLLLKDGSTDFGSMPIVIVSQDTSQVTFEVSHQWKEEFSYLYTRYENDRFSSDECLLTETVDKAWTQQYTAQCMGHSNVAIVDIFISDASLNKDLDTATIPQCCHKSDLDSYPKVQYTFEVHCVPQECSSRRLRGSK